MTAVIVVFAVFEVGLLLGGLYLAIKVLQTMPGGKG